MFKNITASEIMRLGSGYADKGRKYISSLKLKFIS